MNLLFIISFSTCSKFMIILLSRRLDIKRYWVQEMHHLPRYWNRQLLVVPLLPQFSCIQDTPIGATKNIKTQVLQILGNLLRNSTRCLMGKIINLYPERRRKKTVKSKNRLFIMNTHRVDLVEGISLVLYKKKEKLLV